MKVIKKPSDSVKVQDAHGGSGSRKLFLGGGEVRNFQGVTYGWLPSGHMYAWHNHDDLNEIMIVLKGCGSVRDDDGEYSYDEGDFFVFPKAVFHEIKNTGEIENEFVFVRVYDK